MVARSQPRVNSTEVAVTNMPVVTLAADTAQHTVVAGALTFTKNHGETMLMFDLTVNGFVDVAAWRAVIYVKCNGAFTACTALYFNNANVHASLSGGCQVMGVPAGTYSVDISFRSSAVVVANFKTDANDIYRLRVTEM